MGFPSPSRAAKGAVKRLVLHPHLIGNGLGRVPAETTKQRCGLLWKKIYEPILISYGPTYIICFYIICVYHIMYLSLFTVVFFRSCWPRVSRCPSTVGCWGDIGSSCRLTTKSIENYRPNILKTHHWRFVPQTFILLEIYHAKCSTS